MPKSLNPKLWEEQKLRPEVRSRLLQIAKDFIEGVRLEGGEVKGIFLTGSNANFNWRPDSDIDVHVGVDFSAVACNQDIVSDYFYDESVVWKERHNVTIHGHEVELFLQDVKKEFTGDAGVYSIQENKWVRQPTDKQADAPKAEVEKHAKPWKRRIDRLIHQLDQAPRAQVKAATDRSYKLKESLWKLRTKALTKGGEHAVQNLVYKLLRRQGYLDRLIKAALGAYDRSVSLTEGEMAGAALAVVEAVRAFSTLTETLPGEWWSKEEGRDRPEAKWHKPEWGSEEGEFQRVAKDTGVPIERLRAAYDNAKVGPLHPDHFSQLQNTDANTGKVQTVDQVHAMGREYGGKDTHGIHKGLESGASLPAPIVLHQEGKPPTLVAGNTRLTMATVMGRPQHALHVKL